MSTQRAETFSNSRKIKGALNTVQGAKWLVEGATPVSPVDFVKFVKAVHDKKFKPIQAQPTKTSILRSSPDLWELHDTCRILTLVMVAFAVEWRCGGSAGWFAETSAGDHLFALSSGVSKEEKPQT